MTAIRQAIAFRLFLSNSFVGGNEACQMCLAGKDLLGLKEMSVSDIELILSRAREMKTILLSDNKKTTHLSGKTVVTLFYENSTRTRLSFELASKYMGANAANISASGSSVAKGESLADTAKTIDAMGTDAIVLRHPMSGAARHIAEYVSACVINAGDGMHEHPTQGLLDIFTIAETKGRVSGLTVAIVGDALHSRVARSAVYGLIKMGAAVRLASPPTMTPTGIAETGAKIYVNAKEAVDGADVVMALRIQLERQKSGLFPSAREYAALFGVDSKLMSYAKPDAMVMHPGPVNRGVELSAEIADCENSRVLAQVTNGVAVRMAILDLLVNGRRRQ